MPPSLSSPLPSPFLLESEPDSGSDGPIESLSTTFIVGRLVVPTWGFALGFGWLSLVLSLEREPIVRIECQLWPDT
jgi:hypothetical protein